MGTTGRHSRWRLPLAVALALLLSVACGGDNTTEPTTGDLAVRAITTGTDIDADGYSVTLDQTLSQGIGVNGSVTFQNQSTGSHIVELTGVAANCSVTGDNPRTIDLPSDGAETTFDMLCNALTGGIEVTTITTGVDVDPDGYTVVFDGTTSQAIGVNQTATINGLPVGDNQVELTGVADNCTVSGSNPRTVNIPTGSTPQTAQTTFELNCVQALGNLDVITSTTGVDLDPDGYSVEVDGTLMQAIGVTGTVTFLNLTVGDHSVELTGVAANCTVDGSNPRTVSVLFAGSETTFDVSCVSVGRIVFASDRDGNEEVYIMKPDGTGQTNLTNNAAADRTPAGSPDGSKVAFASDRSGNFEIWVMNADGSGLFNLTNDGSGVNNQPAWSPDGTKIAYTRLGGGQTDIYVMSADGSGSKTNITPSTPGSYEVKPTWSPDGTQIAFRTDRDGDEEIYVMNADGSNPRNLTNDAAVDDRPDWSPDGSKIAFASTRFDGRGEVMVMNADGTNQVRITNNVAADYWPTWSPDGNQIAFVTNREGDYEIYVMGADGSNQANLTRASGDDDTPAWMP